MIKYSSFPTIFGTIFLARTERGICRVHLGGSEESFTSELRAKHHSQPIRDDHSLRSDSKELAAYFEDGHEIDRMQIDFLEGTKFERRVWEVLKQIPRGEVRSYHWVAEEVGSPKASRAVGSACGSNPIPFIIPCHRVISSSGGLGGYGYGLDVKRELLKLEGYDVSMLKASPR